MRPPLLASRHALACTRAPTLSAALAPVATTATACPALARQLAPAATTVALCAVGMVPAALAMLLGRRRKLWRRVFTGCSLGAVVTVWIFSGTYAFLATFALMVAVAQNEYYYMARQNGDYPTWKLGTLGSLAMYLTASSEGAVLRDAIFPLTGTATIVYLLLRRERSTPPTTSSDIHSTFMGIFYFGYMPSFWIRMRCANPIPPEAVFSLFASPQLRVRWPLAAIEAAGANLFTGGAIIQWWTMLAIVASDVAAYFAGKKYGRTPLIAAVSPNKTWEGLLGGCAAAVFVSTCGAVLMRWPLPALSGAAYGLMAAVMALIGDLTVSLLKRSAGVKDTGRLLPGHGGLLDRLDSYLLVAAPCYFFVTLALPALRRLV